MKGFKTLFFKNKTLYLLDQRRLPHSLSYKLCRNVNEVCWCIKNMVVRGAPAIGVASSWGVYLSSLKKYSKSVFLYRSVKKSIKKLSSTRPTARNLFWALEKMSQALDEVRDLKVKDIRRRLFKEALFIEEFERKTSYLIGKYGRKLIEDGDNVLTICNAGALATVDYGTALSVIYHAHYQRKNFRVFCCETRPLLQGARLTMWELLRENITPTLITDFSAGRLIQQGFINKVITGADRITLDGGVANKIGTYTLAVLSKRHRIPFYVAAPLSTFDPSLKSWKDIPIEERSPQEVLYVGKKRIAPSGVKVFNPAFDSVPPELISGIITERGIIYPPFRDKIREILNG